jgi:ribosome-associated heat shock protein Hsp15
MARSEQPETAVRLDKWLWAARFFKTRSLAKQAVDGGKVQLGGSRVKAARTLHPGDLLEIRRGHDSMKVTVLQLASRRGPAKVAQTLYQESTASIEARTQRQEQAKLEKVVAMVPGGRPSKKDRRQIRRFKETD